MVCLDIFLVYGMRMEERFTSTDENPGENRCPNCGMSRAVLYELSGQAVLEATCRICESPLSTPATNSTASQPQIQWQQWMATRQLERWIWFLFMLGMVVAGIIGLVRS